MNLALGTCMNHQSYLNKAFILAKMASPKQVRPNPLVGAIVGYYYYNVKNKPKDLRSQKQKDCEKIGGSYDITENIFIVSI